MTSEVAILNKFAVVLAADSAVTTGMPGREKIWVSANKIFTLSKFAPIGIMIFGYVEFQGIPWETIIKKFRHEIKDTKYDTVQEYAERFISYLNNNYLDDKQQEDISNFGFHMEVLTDIKNGALKLGKINGETIKKSSENLIEELIKVDTIKEFSQLTKKEFNKNNDHIQKCYEIVFKDYKVPRKISPSIIDACRMFLIHQHQSNLFTGIAITGFGEKELLPSLLVYTVDGSYNGQIRYFLDKKFHTQKESQNSVFVGAFAQHGPVYHFMENVSDDYQSYIRSYLEKIIKSYTKEILDKHTSYSKVQKTLIHKLCEDSVNKIMTEFDENSGNYRRRTSSQPIIRVIRSAPKEELASIAEALISMASLRNRVSGELETVGGPVDVAVISKGDGFIWVKRKHYFNAVLNPNFVQNYFRN